MKALIAALTAASFVVGAAVPVSAETYREGYEVKQRYKKKKHRVRHYRRTYINESQIEYRADRLPLGTGVWWRQMDREGRGGRR